MTRPPTPKTLAKTAALIRPRRKRAAVADKPSAPGTVASAATAAPAPADHGRACVIGAGLAGLALALRLQAGGLATTLIEAQPRVGGRAANFLQGKQAARAAQAGYRFDTAPLVIADPAPLVALWALDGAGAGAGDDVGGGPRLLAIDPLLRCNWPDGSAFDLPGDAPAQTDAVALAIPDDLGGFEDLRAAAAEAGRDLAAPLAAAATRKRGRLTRLARLLPAMLRHRAWRSRAGQIAALIESERLRQALSAEALLESVDPFAPAALLTGAAVLPPPGGRWAVAGGNGALAEALAALFVARGGTLRLHDPVVRIETFGTSASEIECQSGWRARFAQVASTADPVHTYRELLRGDPRGAEIAGELARRKFAPGMVAVHFAVEGTWPGIPHRTMMFGPRFAPLIADIWQHGVLPQDLAFVLEHPSLTDPTRAPPGKSVFSAWVPVAHLGKLPVDWEVLGPLIESRVLAEVGRRLIPDLADRIVLTAHQTPRDAALDFNLWHGSAGGLEPALPWRGAQRLPARDGRIHNLYFAGASTHQGGRLAALLDGAAQTAALMLEDAK